MRYRGAGDLRASEVGLPVWALLDRPDEQVADLLAAALDLGVALFDADDWSQDGRAERLLGAAVRGHRDEVTLATTFGLDTEPRLFEPAAPRPDWSPRSAGRALDRSLTRLGTEPVDLWQLYQPDADALGADELFQFLDEQVVKGKIRAYGVVLGGPAGPDEGAAALRERGAAAVATVLNAASPEPGRELAAVAAEAGAALLARDPLDALPPAARQRLGFLAQDRGRTLDQALLRLVLAEPAVAAALPAPRDRDHLAELAAAADAAALDADELARVAELQAAGGLRGEA